MGGSISAGVDNDEMIDNLMKSRYIRTSIVEKVFRSVDRAFYFLPEFKHTAYRDLAWKQGNLHLSAPCIYSEVLEHLKLEPCHHFLNIGSGTGYLSTLAGLIIGPYGVNHGIEIHADVVEYAYEKLEQFKKTCNGVDVFEFCEPVFIVGNAFNLNHDRRYDRIYCGAACPEAHQDHIKKFLQIGGILVLPCEDDLLKIVRTSENTWEISSVLPVSFSTLQFPDEKSSTMISMPDPEPLRLQEICRSNIRSLLRNIALKEEPELTQKRKFKQKTGIRKVCSHDNCFVIPIFQDPSSVEAGYTIRSSRFENFRPVAFERLIRNLARNYQNLNDDTYDEGENEHRDSGHEDSDESINSESNENDADQERRDEIDDNDTDENNETDDGSLSCLKHKKNSSDKNDNCLPSSSQSFSAVEKSDESKQFTETMARGITNTDNNVASSAVNMDVAAKTTSFRPRKFAIQIKKGRFASKVNTSKKHNHPSVENGVNYDTMNETLNEGDDSTNDSQPKKVMKREKLDSGISEESDDGKLSISNESSYSESTSNEPMEVDSDDSDFTEDSSAGDNNADVDTNDTRNLNNDNISLRYRMSMENKIKILPLPNSVKLYLNYNREFYISC